MAAAVVIVFSVLYFPKTFFYRSVPKAETPEKPSYSFLLADTPEKRIQGLSGMVSLPPNTVLLFSYDNNDSCGIWMKGMKFSIDVVWLDSNFRIIDFKEGLSLLSYPGVFSPVSPCRYFVEAQEGFIKANNIRIGDKVSINFADFLLNF
ncbi:MAG: hypothetical protein G01um101430_581 [Parcubacteria group bacterium Gr01-1014_30]|nr:MAG: hypothetical protein G01um101430_581 [Parcubacteria group bacterium Gr01-1014_30]